MTTIYNDPQKTMFCDLSNQDNFTFQRLSMSQTFVILKCQFSEHPDRDFRFYAGVVEDPDNHDELIQIMNSGSKAVPILENLTNFKERNKI